MADTVQIGAIISRNSTVAGHAPSSLLKGEVAVNIPDTKMFIGDAAGKTVDLFAGAMSGVLSTEVTARNSQIATSIAALVKSQACFYPIASLIDPTTVGDSWSGFQDCINRCAAAGGGLCVWPAGRFNISKTLDQHTSGVRIIGAGRGAFHDSVPYVQANTLLIWTGAVGGTMMTVGPFTGSNNQKLTQADVLNVGFKCSPDLVNPGAAYGLIVTSTQHSDFDLYGAESTAALVAFAVVAAPIGEAANCEGNTCSLRFRQINLAGTALQIGGSTAGNTCFCEFPVVYGYMNKGLGIDFQNCDNNVVRRAWIDRVQGGTGTTIVFRSDGKVLGGCARVNTILDLSGSIHSGAVYAEGLEVTNATIASYGNRVERFDSSNAAPNFVVGTGASMFWTYNMSPIGLRDSVVKQFSGYYQLTNSVIEFWNATGNLGAGTTSTFSMEFSCARILDVSAQLLGISNAPGSVSCFNYSAASRVDGAPNKFDLYSPSGGVYTYRGKALAL